MTLLSQQLQKLSLPREQVKRGTIQHSSLIFPAAVASDYDTQEILDIGINGFEELVSLNPCFEQFRDTLFHPSSVTFERLTRGEDILRDVDREIELFLAYVSSYGLLSPAHKALEWLVRAYKVHIYNAEVFLSAFIPLHDSKLFGKILEIVTLPENWLWLEEAKANNVNVGRSELVKLCTSNPHYLSYFMERALHIMSITGNQGRIHHSFLVTLVYLVLEAFQEVPPDVVPKVYSCLTTAITSPNKDLKSAGYIITGQVVRKMNLRDDIVKQLLSTLADHPHSSLIRELILCISCVLYYHTISELPLSLVELVFSDEYLVAIETIFEKNDISGFIEKLLMGITKLCFTGSSIDMSSATNLMKLPNLPDSVTLNIVESYFDHFIQSPQEVRSTDSVNSFGEILSSNFPSQVQDTFQKHHSQGCDMAVLDQLKSLILGKYVGNASSQKLLEINHDIPGIRMLGLLKISEKLDSGKELLDEEKESVCASIIERITDDDNSVSLKSISLIKQFVGYESVLRSAMTAILRKIQDITPQENTMSPHFGVSLIESLISFPRNAVVEKTLTIALINFLGAGDEHIRKQISVQIRSSKDLKALSKSIAGNDWLAPIVAYIEHSDNRLELIRTLCDIPTPSNFRVVCSLVEGCNGEVIGVICEHILSLLNTAIDRKFEYKDFAPFSKDVIVARASVIFRNFSLMKKEWEMVGVLLTLITSITPRITDEDLVKKILVYLVRSCTLHQPYKPLLAALDKALIYRCIAKVILADDPALVLSTEGLTSSESVEHFLECIRLVKIREADLQYVLPYLLCALVAPSENVRSWSYKRLKNLSKLDSSSSAACYVLTQLNISKNISREDLKKEIGRVCSCADKDQISAWLEVTLPYGEELLPLYHLLGSVHHVTKLSYSFRLIESGATQSTLLGDLTPATADLLSSDPWGQFLACLTVNPGLIAESLNTDFLGTQSGDRRNLVVRKLLEECNRDAWEEHVKLTIRQKLAELGEVITMESIVEVLKNTDSYNPHALQVLNMQGAASTDLASILFDLLPVRKGSEEEIITLLTSVCTKLGPETPLTPTALKCVVDVIRETNKETHRHSLHHGCVLLLSKLAASFPALVLDHVIAIFTFMGDSTMRMDDNYSIQVLMDAITTIIPVMKQKQDMLSILRVFCDTLPHIPSHRCDPVFSLLLQTAGPAHIYHVFVLTLELCSRDRDLASQFSFFLQNLCLHFGMDELLDTAVSLTQTLAKLPDKLPKPVGNSHKVRLNSGLELSFKDAKHFSYFKLGLATQLYLLTSNKHFTELLSESSQGKESQLAELIELSLSIMIHYQDADLQDKFVEMLNKRLTGVTISVTGELPCSMFMSVVKALLTTETPLLHTKCLNILHNRIKGESGWSTDMEESTVSLLDTLIKLGESQSLTWTVLDLLVKKIGDKYPDKFLSVLSSSSSHLSSSPPSPSLLSCVSSCIGVLGVRILPLLPDLVSVLVSRVSECVSVIGVMVTTVPQFLSAYLTDILIAIAQDYNTKEIAGVTEQIGKNMKIRVLLPAVSKAADTVVTSLEHNLVALTDTLSHGIGNSSTHDIKRHVTDIASIFIKLFSYRNVTTRFECATEDAVVLTFLGLVYKLTEKEFLPLLLQLLEWSEESDETSTTFFNLTTQLSDKLQGLFLIFGGSVFANILDKLKKYKPAGTSEGFESKKARMSNNSPDLLMYVLKTLHNMLKFDKSHSFVTPDRFENLLPVLLDLIAVPDITHLTPALAHLPVAANSDRLWKQYNFQLLNLSKSHDPKIRLNVVVVYHEFITRLGQDYSALLPDTLPFLAELLEDSDPGVEDITHKIVKTIENTTGESMDQYL